MTNAEDDPDIDASLVARETIGQLNKQGTNTAQDILDVLRTSTKPYILLTPAAIKVLRAALDTVCMRCLDPNTPKYPGPCKSCHAPISGALP